VAARFNEAISKKLADGAMAALGEGGVGPERVDVHWVPGSFELPLAAMTLARTRRYAAIVCVGVVIRGETPHYEYVASAAAQGLSRVALETRVPVTFGVITSLTEEQAWERAGGSVGHRGEEAARAALGLAADELGIGIVARLDSIKAVDTLLEAFARVARALPRARLIVIGDGPEAGRLHALTRSLGIDSRVRFTGAVPDAARLLGGLDLYVSASRREGLSLAVLEAMALGLPVVATRVAGHVDAVSDGVTGRLVATDEPRALADALVSLLGEPAAARRALGEAGRRRVEQRFGAERMAAETAALYRAVARFQEGKSSTSGV